MLFGGLLPPGAVSAEAVEATGVRKAAAVGGGTYWHILQAGAHPHGFPRDAGYTHGFLALTIAAVGAAAASLLAPRVRARRAAAVAETMPHAELALLAAGTLAGDQSE